MPQPKIQTAASLLTHSQPYINNANELKSQAERAVVSTEEEFASATDFIKVCQGQLQSLESARKNLVQPLNDHVKWINDQFRPIRETVEKAKQIVSGKGSTWRQAEDKRIRDEAEKARKEAEEQALRDAEAAAESGDAERAEAILDVAVTTPEDATRAPAIRGGLTGASGSTRTNWKGEVKFDDVRSVCKAIADGDLPANMIKEWNKTVMNNIAKSVGSEWPEDQKTGKHHGMTVVKDVSMSVR